MKLPLMLCLAVACAALARAQTETPGKTASPERAPQAAPADGAAPRTAAHASPKSGPEAFWDWFAGSADSPGAFKAPEMPCSLVHDLNNANARAPKRRIADRGQVYFAPFMLSVGANPKLCMYTDAPTIPAEAMLPMSPAAFNDWIGDNDKDQAVRGPLLDYIKAADDAEGPVARMTSDRAKFWPAALKAVLADDGFRASLCAKLEPQAASCPSEIASKSPDDLYRLARSAPASR